MKTKFVRGVMLQLAHLHVSVNPSLWRAMNDELNELERLAEIGRATEKAFDKTEVAMFVSYWIDDTGERFIDTDRCFNFDSANDFIDWAKGE